MITIADFDLVVAGFSVNADKVEAAVRVAKLFDGIVAASDGVSEGLGDGVQWSVVDAKAPDKIGNVGDVLLMRFGGKNDFRTPRAGALADPVVVGEGVELLHHDGRFVDTVIGGLTANWG